MGVNESLAETLNVAKLMGVKTVINEFVAYQQLGKMVVHDPPLLTVNGLENDRSDGKRTH